MCGLMSAGCNMLLLISPLSRTIDCISDMGSHQPPSIPNTDPDCTSNDNCTEDRLQDGSPVSQAEDFITPSRHVASKPKVRQYIECLPKGDGHKFTTKIVSRAGKVGGVYGASYNIQKEDGLIKWINLARQVEKWRVVSDNEEVLIDECDSMELLTAKRSEIDSWMVNDVFEEVEDNGQDTLSVRWVITEKKKNDQSVIKAQLVARGFEENTSDFRSDSPTCSKESLRLAMTVIAASGWTCNQSWTALL